MYRMRLFVSCRVVVSRLVVCVLLCVSWSVCASGEVVVLRSGQTIRGEVLVHDTEVIVVRTEKGARYQYPAAEVVSVGQEQAETEDEAVNSQKKEGKKSDKRVSVRADVSGGAAYLPVSGWGGYTSADLLVGSHNLMNRRVFVGGGVGVHAAFVGDKRYAFVPIQVVAHVSWLDSRHSPVMGMALGYGFSVSGGAKGGIFAGVDVGWKYCFSEKSSLSLCADMQWQQVSVRVSETVDGNAYSNYIGANMLLIGAKIGVQF